MHFDAEYGEVETENGDREVKIELSLTPEGSDDVRSASLYAEDVAHIRDFLDQAVEDGTVARRIVRP